MSPPAQSASLQTEHAPDLPVTTKFLPLHLLPDTAYCCIISFLGADNDDDGTRDVYMSSNIKAFSLLARWSVKIVSCETNCLSLKWHDGCGLIRLINLLYRHRESLKAITIDRPAMLPYLAIPGDSNGFVHL